MRDDFEKALRQGKLPTIEDFLQNPLVPRPLALQHLVTLDLDERLRRREHVRLEEYLTRFPELPRESDAIADLLLLEYEGRARVECDIPFAEYEKRFPEAYPSLARRLRVPRIEGFTILSQLGRGGMGRVYKAREDRLGGRLVAIKVILASALQQSDALRRFQREADATAQIEHPNIARVYQVGQYETEQGDCLPYLVIEYVSGGTLAAAMDAKPQNQRDAAETVECLALAVHAAHQRGIIHRDLKPQNVLLGPEPKITDFGLAKLVDRDSSMTQGQILGTPGYMAPEQVTIKGTDHAISPATDVWALGAILYEALTGRPPFQASEPGGIAGARGGRNEEPNTEGTTSVFYRILHDEPIRPRRLEKGTDPHLEAICLKCLEKKPRDRFASAEALAQELRRFLNHERGTIKPVTPWSEFRRWCRRNPVIASAAAIVLLVVTASAIWSNYARIVAVAARLEANNQQRKAEANEAIAKLNEQKAADLAIKESRQRRRAELQAYVAHIAAAQRSWKNRCGELALAHLDAPHWNLRGWEHDCLYTQFTGGYRAFYGHSAGIHCVAFSPDGMRLASGDGNNVVKLWDVSNNAAIATIRTKKQGHDSVGALAFSPDGARVVGGFRSGAILIWNLTGQVVSTLGGHTAHVSCVSFSPDGNHVLSGSEDNTASLWDATNGKLVHTFSGHREAVNAVAFSPDGTHIASGSRNGQIRLWAAASKQLLHSIEYDNKRLRGMCFDEDGGHIVAIHDDLVTMWSTELAEKVDEWQLPDLSTRVYHLPVAFSSGGTTFAFCNPKSDGVSVFGNIGSLQKELFILREAGSSCLAFSPDGNRIVTGSAEATLKVWDPTHLNTSLCIGELKDPVHSIAISEDGQYLAAALTTQTNAVPVWNTATGHLVATLGDRLTPHVEVMPSVFDVAVSPDGRFIATACQDKTLRLWSVADRKEVKVLQGHTDSVICVAYSFDGAHILSGSRDNTARVWDNDGRNVVVTLRGHEGAVACVAFSPNGQRCLTGSRDCTVRLWDALSGKELAAFRGHSGVVAHVAFSADGKQFVSESLDGALKVWDANATDDGGSRHPR
ncbi:MAG: protein kinase, partial [Rhodopirellula sp.]|nr:protein kinase [Rhodopirellula sp.]